MPAPTPIDLFDAMLALDLNQVMDVLSRRPELASQRFDGVDPLIAACTIATDDLAIPPSDAGPTSHAIVDSLIEAGADPSVTAKNGWTPLHVAGFAGNNSLVNQLLNANSDVTATVRGVPGSTPLSFALFYAHRATGRLLAGMLPSPDDLRSAAALDDIVGVERWLAPDGALRDGGDAGMPFTAPIAAFPPRPGPITTQLTIDESLTWASRNGSLKAMEVLVGRGANVNANPYRGTPLLWAIYANQTDATRWLIENGSDVDLRHDFGGADHGRGATALHLAAQYGAEECAEILLDAGADVSLRDDAHQATPAEWAVAGDQPDLAVRLTSGTIG
jgi:ankyrin repeat protein